MSEVAKSSVTVSSLTEDELTEMIASCDDDAGHHVLWVDHEGYAHIELLDEGLTPAGWDEKNEARIRFRWETFIRGNHYVGLGASTDADYVGETLQGLRRDWSRGRTGYIDFPV